ncbi:MAG TPA: PA2779 family protein [Pyrinomonadaceae bacterium]|nr:PA2779 family protein [Pyrinomonadaceae bacterium]HMP64814.1 PA2779 family protein [Pyrinomonadaceae bacterium]
MSLKLRAGLFVSCLLIISFAVPPSLRAQQHVVSPTDIHKELVNATDRRIQDRRKVNDLFSSEEAERALRGAGMDPGQVRTAVATLSDAELAQLAARSERLQADFAAGRLSNRELLIIILVLAAVVLIIVAT